MQPGRLLLDFTWMISKFHLEISSTQQSSRDSQVSLSVLFLSHSALLIWLPHLVYDLISYVMKRKRSSEVNDLIFLPPETQHQLPAAPLSYCIEHLLTHQMPVITWTLHYIPSKFFRVFVPLVVISLLHHQFHLLTWIIFIRIPSLS